MQALADGAPDVDPESFDNDMKKIRKTLEREARESLSYYAWADDVKTEEERKKKLQRDIDRLFDNEPK